MIAADRASFDAARSVAPSFRRSDAPSRIAAYLDAHVFERPTLVLDIEAAVQNFRDLRTGLATAQSRAHIHYAVKANPEPVLVRRLAEEGCRFDAASRAEIALCIEQGAQPRHISFGNTVKRSADIAWAHAQGVEMFAADAEAELEKIAGNAPGARVYLRLLVEASEADWPLSRKFGAPAAQIPALFHYARALGLRPVGLSFHVGSQTRRAAMWRPVLEQAAELWHGLVADGFDMQVLNVGGGFPAYYGEAIDAPTPYGAGVRALVDELFGPVPYLMAEPGRSVAADAGVIAAEVLLVSRKRPDDIARWVYLDIGKFSGLAETMDEAIRYQIETSADGGETGPCVLAGPSCDSADVLYEQRPIQLPEALAAGDRIRILCAGAYTTTYASIGFNGFPPLDVVCI